MAESSDRRVVAVAVDGSDYSEHAFDWYLQKIRKDKDKVEFIHVTEPPSLPVFSLKSGIGAPTEQWGEIMKKKLEEVGKLEDGFSFKAQGAKVEYKFHHIPNESAGTGIVAKAKACNAELIIMGTRGQNKVRRTILGSVSDYVLHHAGIPVAVVPPN
ncbi:uncharacterized protein LOC116290039 [Actinia tenebrosa]|uniref:Uncharacterized protein LOC116290039 n=1 Tax=Actinia tenebrosa TaxID=6105 RepID=A0A6P8H8X8_ACTTE|nr:uncharacterized protein LOC116290039 [Actinia tenebrosa]